MPLRFVRNDITKMKVDAIVNAANSSLLGGGGVDGAIHRAAGPELLEECRTLNGCEEGGAKATKGYALPAKYVIHTVGPVWRGGAYGEEETLRSCYTESLLLAEKLGCESVAFPLISSGAYGYPKDGALKAAAGAISAFLETHEMLVYLTLFDRGATLLAKDLYGELRSYIDDRSVEERLLYENRGRMRPADACADREPVKAPKRGPKKSASRLKAAEEPLPEDFAAADALPQAALRKKDGTFAVLAEKTSSVGAGKTLEELLKQTDEGFSQSLLRLIDEKGMTDVECYKRANVDRKHFSKIRSNPKYRPSKNTVLAFAVALRLDLAETSELLKKAGYALTHAQKSDIIVEFFIVRGVYDIFAINEALFAFDQALLGA